MSTLKEQLHIGNDGKAYRFSKPGRPGKSKKYGHDCVIESLRGATIHMVLMSNGDTIEGSLKESDRYTISYYDEDGQIHFVYKHAIESFWLVKNER